MAKTLSNTAVPKKAAPLPPKKSVAKKLPADAPNKKPAGKKGDVTPNGTARKPVKRSVKVVEEDDEEEEEPAPKKRKVAPGLGERLRDKATTAKDTKGEKVDKEPKLGLAKADFDSQVEAQHLSDLPDDEHADAIKAFSTYILSPVSSLTNFSFQTTSVRRLLHTIISRTKSTCDKIPVARSSMFSSALSALSILQIFISADL